MGITYIEGTVSGHTGKQATAKFLVDGRSEVYGATCRDLEGHRISTEAQANICSG
jgi:hypothetical protein